jgi:hypothetical protein
LLAAICHREQLLKPILLRVVSLLDFRRTMSPNLVPFALHALSCLIVGHSDSIVPLDLCAHFLNKFVDILGSPVSLLPLMLHFIADVFVNLLPIVSVHLDDLTFTTLVFSIVEANRVTPYQLGKEIYFNCLKSVFNFGPKLGPGLSAVQFPGTSSDEIKVGASGAISVLLKLGGKLEHPGLLSDLFWLLQKTEDSQVSDCISSLADTLDRDSYAIVNQIIHNIFIRN